MDRLEAERMFCAVMETGSFAAAARRLGTSSGQASKLVQRLEHDLGVRLLNRTTRAVSATEAGQSYFDRLRSLVDEFDALQDAVKNAARSPRGRVRLTAPLTFGTMQLAAGLNAFALRYPDIFLDVSLTDRVVNLVDEGFDAAVRSGRAEDDSSLIARKLCDTRVVVIAAPAYLARHPEPRVPADLAAHACIIDTNFRTPTAWRLGGPGGPVTVQVQGRLSYSNAEACVMAAEAGLGIAHVPDFVAADSLARGATVRLLAGYESPPFGFYAMYPPGRHLAARVRVLVDFLADHFARQPGWASLPPPFLPDGQE